MRVQQFPLPTKTRLSQMSHSRLDPTPALWMRQVGVTLLLTWLGTHTGACAGAACAAAALSALFGWFTHTALDGAASLHVLELAPNI